MAPGLPASHRIHPYPLRSSNMRRPSIPFLPATKRNRRVHCVTPSPLRTPRIVAPDAGFELPAPLQGSTARWVLPSPGGLASTFGDLPSLREFASIVLGRNRLPVSYQAA